MTMEEAAARCPFLRNVSKNAALSLDHAVAVLAGKAHERQRKGGRRGPVFEEGDAFSAAFDMFHGPGGVVPLKKESAAAVGAAPVSCSASSHASGLGVRRAHPAAFASISIGAFGPPLPPPGSNNGRGGNNGAGGKGGGRPPVTGEGGAQSRKPESFSTNSLAGTKSSPLEVSVAAEALCPLRKAGLGGLIDLTYGKGIKFACPPAICKMRAAVNKLPAVKALRPQALETRIAAAMVFAGLCNMPLGVWREHTKKFSPAWFVAVHASIPWVAMARKSLLMPHWCVAFTILSAISGQQVGAKSEKKRVQAGGGAAVAMQGCKERLRKELGAVRGLVPGGWAGAAGGGGVLI